LPTIKRKFTISYNSKFYRTLSNILAQIQLLNRIKDLRITKDFSFYYKFYGFIIIRK